MVNILVVGCGAVVEQLYCKPLRELENRGWAGICGVVDPAERRREAATTWFKHTKAFSDLETAFAATGKVDLTIVTSPPAYHNSHTIAAFAHGSHVLCEKPIAHSVSAAEQMVEAAKTRNRILAVGMVRRFYPSFTVARTFVRDQAKGSKMNFAYREGSIFNWPIASSAQFRRETGGGGVLIDKGVHALDSLHYVFGPGSVLRSADDALGRGSVESNAAVELEFAYGRGCLQVSWETELNNGFHVAGPLGDLWLPLSSIQAAWQRGGVNRTTWQKMHAEATWPSSLDERRPKLCVPRDVFECMGLQLVSVMRSILLGEPSVATGEDGLEVLRLVMSAYDQATPLKQPWLPPSEQALNASHHWRACGLGKASA